MLMKHLLGSWVVHLGSALSKRSANHRRKGGVMAATPVFGRHERKGGAPECYSEAPRCWKRAAGCWGLAPKFWKIAPDLWVFGSRMVQNSGAFEN